MKPQICFYHSGDLDGKCSAAIVRRKFPDCELYGINYGELFPMGDIIGREVIMVDFSLPWPLMQEMAQKASHLIWIDHHQTAIDEFGKQELPYNGTRVFPVLCIGVAACELCWEYFFPEKEMPVSVYLLGRYDVWNHKSDNRILPFQYGMRQDNWNPEDIRAWQSLLDDTFIPSNLYPNVEKLVEQG